MMKNRFFAILIALILALPVYQVQGEEELIQDSNAVESTVNKEQPIADTENTAVEKPSDADVILTKDSYRQPTSKRKVAKKFLLAMFGVGVSSIMIFAGLSAYNSIRKNFVKNNLVGDDKKSSLEAPEDLNGAIKSFLERTNWEN